jgi:uncharacterized membrane protein
MARYRLWLWLAVTAVVFGALWTLPGIDIDPVAGLGARILHVLAGYGLAAALIVAGLFYGPPAEPGRMDPLSSAALSVYLLLAALLVHASTHDPVALIAFVVLTVATVAIAWRSEAAAGAVGAAAILSVLAIADWAVGMNVGALLAPSGATAPAVPEPERFAYGPHLWLGALWMALYGVAGFLAQGRSRHAVVPMLWGAVSVFAPLGILVALYYRLYGFERSMPFAALALLLAALYGVATEALVKRAPRLGMVAASALYATGALAALALSLTFALEKGWLTIGLALMVPAAAWVAERRPLPWLRWLAAAMVVLVLARIGYEPRIVGADVGTTPVFNWLLYGYGIPAISFWFAAHLMRRHADDVPARIVDAGAILFTVLLAFLEVRHFINNGDVYRPSAGLAELALQVCVALAMTIGLERLRARTRSVVHDLAALALAGLSLIGILALQIENPRATGTPVGGIVINLILLGYALPAVLTAVLALVTRGSRPRAYSIVAAVAAVWLSLGYLTLQVTRIFHGPVLTGPIGDAEQYTYSTVWLAFGVILLAVGFYLRSQPVRYAAMAVIVLTIAKVFIVDTAGVSGIYRALSVIGLGVVLLGIGWLYQRLLYPRTAPPAMAASASPGAGS